MQIVGDNFVPVVAEVFIVEMRVRSVTSWSSSERKAKQNEIPVKAILNLFIRIQAGQYSDAHEMLNDLLKLEEESLGARTDKLADIYQLMSKTKSEVTINDQQLHSVRLTCAMLGEHWGSWKVAEGNNAA